MHNNILCSKPRPTNKDVVFDGLCEWYDLLRYEVFGHRFDETEKGAPPEWKDLVGQVLKSTVLPREYELGKEEGPDVLTQKSRVVGPFFFSLFFSFGYAFLLSSKL